MTRELDIIIFGATGFTGKRCIPTLHRLLKANNLPLKWGVGGRNETKLRDVLNECSQKTGESFSNIPVVVADIEDEQSLCTMASKARIVINCCGPYRFFGENVVKSCVAQGTHHVDVSGEPQYMERMQLKYHKAAQANEVYVISACGFDSIPMDMGVVFVQQQFKGTVNSIVTYLQLSQDGGGDTVAGPTFNYATWESLIYGLAHVDDLKELRKKLYATKLPTFTPKLELKGRVHKTSIADGWAVPFMGADRSVVKRSQRYFYDEERRRPIQLETYFLIKSYFHVALMIVLGGFIVTLVRAKSGRELLLKYPELFTAGFFSKKPPSDEKIRRTLFSITLCAKGWKETLSDVNDEYTTPPNKSLMARVKGRNPGYGAACDALILSAITVITETDKLPNSGGVYPPGAAFAKTSLIEKLNENGITFEVIQEKDL